MSDKVQKAENSEVSNNQTVQKKPTPKKDNKFVKAGVAIQTKQGALPPIESKQGKKPPIKSPQRGWSYQSPQTKTNKSAKEPPVKDDKKVTLSHGFMMLTSEGSFGDDHYTVKKPHWPGANSGVTIGFGFDIGAAFAKGATGQSQAKEAMIEAGIDSATASMLCKYVGIRGSGAAKHAEDLRKKGISITNTQALKLLNTSYRTFNDAVHKYGKIKSDQIHPALEQVFTYFAYAWWDFSRTKNIYAQVKGKPALQQFTIASNIIGAEFKKTGIELLHLVTNYLNAIKGHLQNGKEVEISKEVMSIQQLLDSNTFSMMDKTTKGVGKRVNKGSVSRAILTGKRYTPQPQIKHKKQQAKQPYKLTNTRLKESSQGFSVGASNGIYTGDLINCVKDVQKIQKQLLAVGLLSKADYDQEVPKDPRPDYSDIKTLERNNIIDVERPGESVLQELNRGKELEEKKRLQQTREDLLTWLQGLSDKEVRAIAENPNLNTGFAELVIQSGIGGITSKGQMIAKLFELKGQNVDVIPTSVASVKQPESPELPYIHYMSDFEQRAFALYGKIPIGVKVSVANLPKTIEAIRIFQQEIVRMSSPDGRIDANGSTLSQLMSATKESVTQGRANYQAYLQKLAEEEKRRKEEEIKRKEEEARKKSKKTKKVTVEKKPTPRQRVEKIYKDYLLGAINFEQLAHQLIPYAGNAASSIIKIYDEINWALRDNFAYAMCAHLNDAQLLKFDKNLLTRMRDEFEESMFFKSAMKDQKARLDKLLKVQAINEKRKKAAAKKKSSGNATLDALMKKKRLTSSEIKLVRGHVEKLKDDKKKSELYLKLQSKVIYNSQRDSKAKYGGKQVENIFGGMCNLTSVAMCLSYLGIGPEKKGEQNFEDELETKMQAYAKNNKFPYVQQGHPLREWLWARVGMVKEFYGVESKYIANVGKKKKNWYQKEVRDKYLSKGWSAVIGYGGHLMRLEAVSDKGLIIDDPYAKALFLKTKGGYKRSNSAYNKSGFYDYRYGKKGVKWKEVKDVGEDNLWSWDVVQNISINTLEFYKK